MTTAPTGTRSKRIVYLVLAALVAAGSGFYYFGIWTPRAAGPAPGPVQGPAAPSMASAQARPAGTTGAVDPARPATPSAPAAVTLGPDRSCTINGVSLRFGAVEFGHLYHGMFAPAAMQADQTVLSVEMNPRDASGIPVLSALKAWVQVDQQTRVDNPTTLTREIDAPQVTWLFCVPKTARSFSLHFPNGEIVELTPLLP